MCFSDPFVKIGFYLFVVAFCFLLSKLLNLVNDQLIERSIETYIKLNNVFG